MFKLRKPGNCETESIVGSSLAVDAQSRALAESWVQMAPLALA